MERLHVAVAEDNPMDLLQVKTALDELGLDYNLTVATDGEQARDFIMKKGRYSGFPPAHLIFLDMNMPKLSGLEVLQTVPDSASLPICLLTSSEGERKLIEEHFAPKKVSYLLKPVTGKQLLSCMRGHEHLKVLADRLENH